MAPEMMVPAGAPQMFDPMMMRLSSSLLSSSSSSGASNYSGFQMLAFPAQLLPFNATIPLHSLIVPPAISTPTTLFDQHYFASKSSNPYFIHMFYNNNSPSNV